MAIAFCEIIKQAGYIPGVYANKYWFENKINHEVLINYGYKIWFAQYNKVLTSPQTSLKVDMWQYSSSGKVPGIVGNVDLDYCLCDCVEKKNPLRYKEGVLVRIKVKSCMARENGSLMIEIKEHQYWKKEQDVHNIGNEFFIFGIIGYKDEGNGNYIIAYKIAHNPYDSEMEEQDRFLIKN